MSKHLHVLWALLILLILPAVAISQIQAVGQPKVLVDAKGNFFQNPVWSPDGNSFAFTSVQYQGIWVADKNGENIRQLTDKNAGYRFSWTSDSKGILSRVSQMVNRRKQSALVLFDKDSQSEHQLTEFRSGQNALPQWVPFEDKMVLILGNKIEVMEVGKSSGQNILRSNQFSNLQEAQELVKSQGDRTNSKDISPFEDAFYLNPQVSPDGQKLAFEIYGGNMYVMNVDGTRLIDLGPGHRPQWSPDSRYILANRTTDDGHNITKADIIAFSVDGKEKINLTTGTSLIAMNPSWSPDDKSILFNDPNTGNIYSLEISR